MPNRPSIQLCLNFTPALAELGPAQPQLVSDNCQHLPQFEFGNVLVHNSLLIKDQNVWMSMISPLKRFLAAVAADLGHTTRDIQVLNLEMVRLFLIDWAL